jgi:hypothetical protein
MSIKCIEQTTSILAHHAELDSTISAGAVGQLVRAEQKKSSDRAIYQIRKWLIYWVIYGLFSMFEVVSDKILSWLPMYYPIKLAFLLWCFLPQTQGAITVFNVLVRPVLNRHAHRIDSTVASAVQGKKQCMQTKQSTYILTVLIYIIGIITWFIHTCYFICFFGC